MLHTMLWTSAACAVISMMARVAAFSPPSCGISRSLNHSTPPSFRDNRAAPRVRCRIVSSPLHSKGVARKREIFPSHQLDHHCALRLAASSSMGEDVDASEDEGPVVTHEWTKKTAQLAIPALVGMVADPLLSLIDTMFVARMGAVPLAALGACTSIFHLAFNAFRATTASTAALVAGALVRSSAADGNSGEEGEEDEAKVVARTSLRLAIGSGIAVSILLLTFAEPCLRAMGIRGEDVVGGGAALLPPALSYLRWRAIAAPAVLALTASEGVFRGNGDTRTPLIVAFVAAGINLVLDPVCMFMKPFNMGIKGAAVATAVSQFCAAGLYLRLLVKRKMVPSSTSSSGKTKVKKRKITKNGGNGVTATILRANAAMFAKQGSLLLGWACATRRATSLGAATLAAHQVALSSWLVVALVMDGAGVAAQILMSGEWERLKLAEWRVARVSEEVGEAEGDGGDTARREAMAPVAFAKSAVRSLSLYMMSLSLLQGLVGSATLLGLGAWKPVALFTTDPEVSARLVSLVPHLAANMVLVSATLVTESLAVGGGRFRWLAGGTALSSWYAVRLLNDANNVVEIWSGGIVALFAGRLLTAVLGVLDMNGAFLWRKKIASVLKNKRRDGVREGALVSRVI